MQRSGEIASPSTLPSPETGTTDVAAHALVELRRVGAGLCHLLDDWLRGRDAPRLTSELVRECRAQLPSLSGPLASVDDAAPRSAADEERALRGWLQRARTDDSPLSRLRRNAGLAPIDVDVLLLAALPEESALWGALFQALGCGNPGRPTVHLALNLWLSTARERVALQLRLREGPLATYQLVRLGPAEQPLAARALCVADRLWPALLGGDAPLDGVSHETPPVTEPILRGEAWGELRALRDRLRGEPRARVVLRGHHGVGRGTTAHWLAAQLGRSVVEARWPEGEVKPAWWAALVQRALVRDAALVLLAEPAPELPIVVDLPLPDGMAAILVAPERCEVRGAVFRNADRLHLPPPGVGERIELWRAALAEHRIDGSRADELGRVFRLRGGDVRAAVQRAARLAQLGQRGEPTLADMAQAVRERPALRLEAMARRRQPRAGWDDLILPPTQLAQLRELLDRVRHRDRVFEEWGVVEHVSRKGGVAGLFVGPSGTGKTLAGEVIAGALGLDLYCVDLSQTISKYIGETEKALARIFDAAEATAAMLLFDEADALFGKRTETRDAHDRYANQEVSYLLARLESFDGIAILTSNLRQNIDSAFMRRMDFVVEFPPPDAAARVRLWRGHLRSRAPLADGIDVHWLAQQFPVSGGHIRNAAVAAAFHAAADGSTIDARHLVCALRREYEKLGKAFPISAAPEKQ